MEGRNEGGREGGREGERKEGRKQGREGGNKGKEGGNKGETREGREDSDAVIREWMMMATLLEEKMNTLAQWSFLMICIASALLYYQQWCRCSAQGSYDAVLPVSAGVCITCSQDG